MKSDPEVKSVDVFFAAIRLVVITLIAAFTGAGIGHYCNLITKGYCGECPQKPTVTENE